VYSWRTGATFDATAVTARLDARDWAYFVIAPPGRPADSGDLTTYVTHPRQR
jgi:hypothetical protein